MTGGRRDTRPARAHRRPLAIPGARLRVPAIGWADLTPLALSRREFSIQQASLLLMATFLASAVLGAARQVLLGSHFGANEVTGAFQTASRLPDVLATLIAGGALSSALLPVLAARRQAGGEAAAWRLASLVLNALVVTLLAVSLVGIAVAPWLIERVLLTGYAPETQRLATDMTRVMLIQPVILGTLTVITAWLNSRNRFFLPAIGVACHNLGILGGILAAMVFPAIGIWGPVWGVVGGAVLQLAISAIGLIGEDAAHHWAPRLNLGDPGVRDVALLLIPNGLSMGVNYAGWLVQDAFGSTVDDPATLTALTNAWLIAGLSVTLLGAAIGQASFPRMAAAVAAGDRARFGHLLRRTLVVPVLLSLPVVLALLTLGDPVVRLLFDHGAYGDDATRLTQRLLTAYAIGLPFYIATEIASRAILATRDARTPLLTNILQLAIRAALIAALLPVAGVVAIPVALAVSSAAEAVTLTWLAQRRVDRLRTVPAPAPR